MNEEFISIGKIMNFFGIKGEAKIGYSNQNQIKTASVVHLLDNSEPRILTVSNVRFHKNFAIVKFREINDINDLMPYKGQRIFIKKDAALKVLEKDEFLIRDLVGLNVFQDDKKIGTIENVSTNGVQDILNIKDLIGKIHLVPFVSEFFPEVDIKNKRIIITPIEGLLE